MTPVLTIGELSRRSGIAASALRYYEERGLITAERARSGHRRYPRHVLRRVAFIVFAQRVGLTIDEIGGELSKLPSDRAPTRDDWSELSQSWLDRIDRRIESLQRLRLGLTECIGCATLELVRDAGSTDGNRPGTSAWPPVPGRPPNKPFSYSRTSEGSL